MNIRAKNMVAERKKTGVLLLGTVFIFFSIAQSSYGASQLSQCANDSDNDGIIQACTWTNGALVPNNSDYAESDGVPQRWFFTHTSGAAAEAHTAIFQYDFTKSDVYAYDFLVDVDHTMPMSLINPCSNLPPFVDPTDCLNAFAVSDNIPIPSDPFDAVAAREHPPSRNIRFGCIQESGSTDACSLISIDPPVHVPATNCFQNCGDSSVQITVHFTTPAGAGLTHLIGMWFAAELAPADDPDGAGPKIGWGAGFGASSAPGASFHFRLIELDGQNIGAQDDQLLPGLIEQSHNADLGVTKSCPASVVKGNNVTYTIHVTNNGPDTATNVFADDTLPIGTTFVSGTISQGTCAFLPNGTTITALNQVIHCAIGFMQPNDTVTLTITVTVPSGFSGTSITDSVTVGGPVIDPVTSNDTASCTTNTTTPVASANLSVSKSCPSPAIAGAPGNMTYTITVKNLSTTTNATNVVLTDSLPGGTTFVSSNPGGPTCTQSGGIVTCDLGTINACGDSPGCNANAETVTITVHVDPSVRGSITNVVTVSGSEADDNTTDNTSSCQTTVNGQIDLQVSKTCDPSSVTAGDTVTFQVTVSNPVGPSTSLDTHLEDIITPSAGVTFTFVSANPSQGSGCSFDGVDTVHCVLGDIAPGGTATLDITVLINSGSSGSISDDAHIHIHTPDEDTNHCNDQPVFTGCSPACTACSCTTDVTGTPEITVDLSVTKSAPTHVFSGNDLTYTLTVMNNSGIDAHNVVLTDTLPGNVTFFSSNPGSAGFPTPPSCSESIGVVTCYLGTLGAGSSTQVTITVTVNEFFVGTLTNVVTVAGDEPDPDTSNNTASADTLVDPPPVNVPTLNEWGMIVFMLLAGLTAVYYLRRQRRI